jgi:hypothetical protein
MTLSACLELVSHPGRWFGRRSVETKPRRKAGLLARLSDEQRKKVLGYKGPEASGDQSLPKLAR